MLAEVRHSLRNPLKPERPPKSGPESGMAIEFPLRPVILDLHPVPRYRLTLGV